MAAPMGYLNRIKNLGQGQGLTRPMIDARTLDRRSGGDFSSTSESFLDGYGAGETYNPGFDDTKNSPFNFGTGKTDGITPTLPDGGNSIFGDSGFGFNQGTAQILKGIMDGISGYQLNNRRLEQLELGRDQLNELKATNLFNQGLARQNAERQKTTVNNQIGAQQRVLAARRSATDPTKMGGAANYEHLRLLT